jgi:hypothetical protein
MDGLRRDDNIDKVFKEARNILSTLMGTQHIKVYVELNINF